MATSAPRRLTAGARRAQLTALGLELAARDGWEALSLEAVAEAADVTRGLLYRYFPDGRNDLLAAVADLAAERLSGGFTTDPDVPLSEKTPANLAFVLEHAQRGSAEWVVFRHASATSLPEVRRRVDELIGALVSAISLNNLGTPDPPPLAALAIRGYIAFAASVLDDWRAQPELDRDAVLALLARVWEQTISGVR